ncbi:MAG: hypothetical protein DWB56_04430 [Candidatus Jettenia sp.]|uniref:Sulfotransferase n=1 Tax=Candidatus Jettenia caeni TaxID=247490 RepID=I3IQT5_9BACT|nr:sulfotransferase [Candidatus Jettenia sp. AMX1]MBC6928201.1 hypothetical protein [Candidatus Jettenia sp.]GAB64080.1 sulfotransferase [Candidatus Jettenia caeni]KAA0248992.1 MAG: hypothetical protein EDM77_10350 [Candidatus Jettenia sp. AMX1]MCE7879590.1 hypothetical protein [Candidatus Jettenia sp. AMX1]MCQ3926949.1 hypothetical protein [Candidatus Jettenia sp.]
MTSKIKLPTFFVVGVQKAGTTTLHDWLIQQSEVCLPRLKETHFFSRKDIYNRGLNWYLNQFPKYKDNVIVGEVDPDYIFYEEAPLRIRELVESPKFIFIFRNPIDRAYSHYLMSFSRGYETLSFKEALIVEASRCEQANKLYMPHHSYIARGMYCTQVNRYRKFFPTSAFLFIKFDDLFGENSCIDTYDKICKFIGINSFSRMVNFKKRQNQASKPRSITLRNFIYGHSPFKKAIGSLIPSESLKLKFAIFLDRINKSPIKIKSENWRESVPDKFWDVANDEILKVESLTGLNLHDWMHNKVSIKR